MLEISSIYSSVLNLVVMIHNLANEVLHFHNKKILIPLKEKIYVNGFLLVLTLFKICSTVPHRRTHNFPWWCSQVAIDRRSCRRVLIIRLSSCWIETYNFPNDFEKEGNYGNHIVASVGILESIHFFPFEIR